jgi:uncharacterized cupredoxin-like copper-binding protein
MMRLHTPFRSAMIVGMLLVLAACGGAPQAANPASTAELIQVRLKSFAIEISTNTVKAGPVAFQASNTAPDAIHEMLVVKTDQAPDSLPYDAGESKIPEDKIQSLGEVSELEAGKDGALILNLQPGKYLLFCNIATHFKSGMVTSLTVN